MEILMIKKLITLFKLGRKVAKSDILSIASKFKKPPIAITILFQLLSISFSKKNLQKLNTNEGERLSSSLESMGTTFIKLGQFLATRPDIIGEELSAKLENLQDRLPPFSINQAQEIIKKDLGEETYNSIIDLSDLFAAAHSSKFTRLKLMIMELLRMLQ
jgi:ubiquinone biosynthesis protein